MQRRDFIKLLTATGVTGLSGCSHLSQLCSSCLPFSQPRDSKEVAPLDEGELFSGDLAEKHKHSVLDSALDDLDLKRDFFEKDFADDIFADQSQWPLVQAMVKRLRAIQAYVGHGNFNILTWDEMLRYGRYAPGLKSFSKEELKFLEELFFFEAKNYGFMGEKVFLELTSENHKKDFEKVPYSGHFLKKGEPLKTYQKVKSDVGETLILTSGYRGLVKQFHLFLEKTLETKGNFSRASRSLAPPGYSFHGRGDFDVGKVGHGMRNFSNDFARTDEYKRLSDLGYVGIRYSEDNLLGVRFEPWHIRV